MVRTLMVLAGILLAAAADARAQDGVSEVGPGQRVRIHEGKRKVVGTLLSADSTTMRLLTGHTDTAVVVRADVTSIDVSVGQKSRAGSGALIGAGVGATGAALIGYILTGAPDLDSSDEALAYVAAGAVGGLLLGAIVGAVVGSGSHTDRWEPTAWPSLDVGLVGSDGRRVAVGLRIKF